MQMVANKSHHVDLKHDDVSASCYNFFSAASKWTKYVFMPV